MGYWQASADILSNPQINTRILITWMACVTNFLLGWGRADGLFVCACSIQWRTQIQNWDTGISCLDAAYSWKCLISCALNSLIINFPRHSKFLFCTFPVQNCLDKTYQILCTRGSSGENKLEALILWTTSTTIWERYWKASKKDRNMTEQQAGICSHHCQGIHLLTI